MSLAALIKRLEDIMRSDPGIDGTAQRLSQIVWLLFLKVFDYKEEEAELEDDYEPVVPEGYRWRDWATCESVTKQLTGDALIAFINNRLMPALRGEPVRMDDGTEVVPFPDTTPRALLVKEFMSRSHNYSQSGIQLRQVINLFDEVDFSDAGETHEFNDVYEMLLKSLQSAGKAGEFYTPRAITSFAVKHVDPRVGETSRAARAASSSTRCAISRPSSSRATPRDSSPCRGRSSAASGSLCPTCWASQTSCCTISPCRTCATATRSP